MLQDPQDGVVNQSDEDEWYCTCFVGNRTCRGLPHTQARDWLFTGTLASCIAPLPFPPAHDLFMTSDLQDNPFVMSTMREYEDDPNGQRSYYYRVIIWLKTVRHASRCCANSTVH